MKNIFLLLALTITMSAAAQQSATFQVSGNCGMCKNRIEKAAKEAGATEAKWDKESQKLSVSFASNSSVTAIQQKIAAVGHDNAGAKATDEAYDKLHGCCKYDRSAAKATADKESCCTSGESCKHEGASGKKSNTEKSCSKDEKCSKSADCSKDNKKMDCCKEGKCSKSSNSEKDCCKKG